MNATHTCCPTDLLPALLPALKPVKASVLAPVLAPTQAPTQRPLWARLGLGLQAAVASWQAAAYQRHCQRALQGLSEETLRDIGMAERLPSQPQTLGLLDYERGRWS